MASIEGLTTDTVELADRIAEHLGSTQPRVVKMALMLLAVDLGLRADFPRKEKENAG